MSWDDSQFTYTDAYWESFDGTVGDEMTDKAWESYQDWKRRTGGKQSPQPHDQRLHFNR